MGVCVCVCEHLVAWTTTVSAGRRIDKYQIIPSTTTQLSHPRPQKPNKKGMVILDDALGPAWSQALRAEIEHLAQLGWGCMKPNQTRFGPTEVR